MNVAIKVDNLSKKYIIRHENKSASYDTLSESLILNSKKIAKRIIPRFNRRKIDQHSQEEFWALKDINFEINQGDRVGIIGRNGAGKSTLLKILSRITEHTTGKIQINGRIASLLEVGTGFHPELTGRENIFLNGAVLGMSREEIKKKFEEIVAFAEVEKFLDTPVKRYSSGMYVRLAFSIAAHLEPDILVIDEVLAVGDIAFQKKCLAKVKQVNEDGKTILMVSHNMDIVRRFCDCALVLDQGEITFNGGVDEAVNIYCNSAQNKNRLLSWKAVDAPGNEVVKLNHFRVLQANNTANTSFDIKSPIEIEFEYTVYKEDVNINAGFFLHDAGGAIVFISGSMHEDMQMALSKKNKGYYKSICRIPGNFLAEGWFSMSVIINTLRKNSMPVIHVHEKDLVSFHVFDDLSGQSARLGHTGAYFGAIRPILEWKTEHLLSNSE